MQRCWIGGVSVFRVAGEEATGLWVVVSGAEIVEVKVGVVLFATIEIVVGYEGKRLIVTHALPLVSLTLSQNMVAAEINMPTSSPLTE